MNFGNGFHCWQGALTHYTLQYNVGYPLVLSHFLDLKVQVLYVYNLIDDRYGILKYFVVKCVFIALNLSGRKG